jgi:hypothetical protein
MNRLSYPPETNYRARGLYDKYTPHSGFLRYVILNKDA